MRETGRNSQGQEAVMKRHAGLGVTLIVCAAAEAAEPAAVAPPATAPPAAPVAKPAAKPLDLRIGDVRRYMLPEEYTTVLNAPDAEQNTVIVEGKREVLASKDDRPVPVAIAAPFWALANPLQAWRIFVPDPKAPPPGPPDVVPPRVFRWGP
jgi:hypothetical protein